MATESFELKYINSKDLNQSWFFKMVERGRIICEKLKSKTDLDEEELEGYMKWTFKAYQEGEYPIMGQRLALNDEKAVDQTLFAGQNDSKSPKNQNGKDFDIAKSNKTIESNGKED
jgi:hypothetical protein